MYETKRLKRLIKGKENKAMEHKILKTLTHCPLFQGMAEEKIDRLLDSINNRLVSFDKHDIYALAGYPCRYADIVIKGELVASMVSLSGKYVEISRLKAGDMVAPAFIFASDNRMPVSVEAGAYTQILRISKSELKRLIDADEKIRMNYIQTIADIEVFLTRKMRILSLLTVREKVAYFILSISKEQGTNTVKLDKSRQEIADSFGIQKFSLLRCMSELVDAGAIKVDGKTITILDRNKMG